MLQKAKDLLGMAIVATDGIMGDIEDFYFDDTHWTIRYLVVNTGSWLEQHQVLISPHSITRFDLIKHQLQVNLTREQVQSSPDIDTHKPVSRQQETALADHYGFPYYWSFPVLVGDPFYPASIEFRAPVVAKEEVEASLKVEEESGDPHLRSLKDVTDYAIAAADGEIGHVADFLIEEESHVIRYMVVATRNWLPGDKVLIAPNWIEEISWEDEKVSVRLSKEAIRNSPVFDENALNRAYEEQLYRYYNQSTYWPDDNLSK